MTAVEWLFKELWDTHKDKLTWYAIREEALEMEKQQNEISDEEIETLRLEYFKENGIWSENRECFTKGAKWYREQLKQRK